MYIEEKHMNYRASPHDYLHRKQLACAAPVLDPTPNKFSSRVKNVSHALYSPDNPVS
jgi:hypothetical protein